MKQVVPVNTFAVVIKTSYKLHLKKIVHFDAYHHTFFDTYQDELLS